MAPTYAHPLPFGAEIGADGNIRFRLWAPSVQSVSLAVDGGDAAPMRAAGGGWFGAERRAPPGTRYSFVLPDGLSFPDPAARQQAEDVHGPSVLVDPRAYRWKNVWSNRPWHEAVILELHPGLCGGFAGIERMLPDVAATGITAIELMPVNDFPGRRNWGYDGVLPFAPDRAYGTPDDLKSLVDAAHGHGLMAILDVVYNHFGPDGAYLHAYAHEFFDEGVHTPWGAAIAFARPEVADFFLQNALMWLNEYRFDGLRFDATHAIAPQEALPVLAERIRAGADHPVHLILEHEGNRTSLLRRSAENTLFDAQWADDWHHCMHVLLTGECEGYYEDFASGTAEKLARALAEGFVFQGQESPHLGRPRGEPSVGWPTTGFVICLQNHDQIGNRAMGDRLITLADPEALRAATALLLLSPFIPLLFMGEPGGARNPFLFFTDHNEQLAPLVRDGRRREFAHFAAFRDEATRARIPDPNAPDTFERSVPEAPDPASLAWYRSVLALRREHITPGMPGAASLGAEAIGERAVRAAWRLGNGATLTLASNFGAEPVPLAKPPGVLLFASGEGATDGIGPRRTLAFLEPPR